LRFFCRTVLLRAQRIEEGRARRRRIPDFQNQFGGVTTMGGEVKVRFLALSVLGAVVLVGACSEEGGHGSTVGSGDRAARAAMASVGAVLDLSRVKEITHVRLHDTRLTRIVLPSNEALTLGQLRVDNNPELGEIAGFENITLTRFGITVSGAYSVRIVDNPLLSTCRAYQLRDLFLAAGFDASTMTISGNAPDC
jgi:hypothetical protein